MDEGATTPADAADVLDDGSPDDAGGVPFDDDFDDGAPLEPGPGDRAPAGAPAYDSGAVLTQRGIGYPDRTPVGMTALAAFLQSRWGGQNLGCLSKPPRPMRGGGQPSLHCWGIALDWRWAGPGPGRAAADEMITFFLEHAGPLGVQAVHDYERCRYWKSYNGWNTAKKSGTTGFGQPWAQWLHIERTWAGANDDRAIAEALRDAGATPDDREQHEKSVETAGTVVLPEPVLKLGDAGADVARLQDFLRLFGFADFTRSDGRFGPRTERAVKSAQSELRTRALYTARIDGEYGPRSAAAAAAFLAANAPKVVPA